MFLGRNAEEKRIVDRLKGFEMLCGVRVRLWRWASASVRLSKDEADGMVDCRRALRTMFALVAMLSRVYASCRHGRWMAARLRLSSRWFDSGPRSVCDSPGGSRVADNGVPLIEREACFKSTRGGIDERPSPRRSHTVGVWRICRAVCFGEGRERVCHQVPFLPEMPYVGADDYPL